MRVPEKYSTLPAEDRSVHIVNICAIEDLGYLPSEGTVSLSSGAVTGYLSAPCKDAGGSHSRTCDPETRCHPDQVRATRCTLRVLPPAERCVLPPAERSARGPLSVPGIFAALVSAFAVSPKCSARGPQSVAGVSTAHCQGSPECSEVSRVSPKSPWRWTWGFQNVLEIPKMSLRSSQRTVWGPQSVHSAQLGVCNVPRVPKVSLEDFAAPRVPRVSRGPCSARSGFPMS